VAGRRRTRIDEAEAEEVALLLTRSLRASMMEGSRTTEAPVLEACGARRLRSDAGGGVRGGQALGCGTDGRRERDEESGERRMSDGEGRSICGSRLLRDGEWVGCMVLRLEIFLAARVVYLYLILRFGVSIGDSLRESDWGGAERRVVKEEKMVRGGGVRLEFRELEGLPLSVQL
jgi:hypothetical protein